MDNQEAIETIKLALSQIEWEYPMDYAVAFDMAISALQEKEVKTQLSKENGELHPTCTGSEELKSVSEELKSAHPELCEDAVSRQRLLSDLKELIAAWKKYPVMAEQIKGVETAIEYVEMIPSVTPERKKGKWINISDGVFEIVKCDQCGRTMDSRDNFCPKCGSYNGGDEDVNE